MKNAGEWMCVHDSINIITATGEGKDLFVQEAASCPARAKQPAVIQRAVTPRTTGEKLWETSSPSCLKHLIALLQLIPMMEGWTVWDSNMCMGIYVCAARWQTPGHV